MNNIICRNKLLKRLGSPLLFALFALFASSQKVSAQTTLSLNQAVELAVQQSLALQRNRIDLATAEYAADRLWSEIFPSISASAGMNYRTPLFTGDGFQVSERNLNYNISLGLNITLRAGLPYSMKIITLAYQSALLNYEDARRQLEINVAKNFYTLLLEQRYLELLKENLALAERLVARNSTAFDVGLISQREYLQSQLSVETARLNLNRAEMNYNLALMNFLTGLGMDTSNYVVLDGIIDIEHVELDPEALILTYLSRRPDIMRQEQTIERLEYAQRQSVLDNRAPSLSLSSQWSGGGNFSPNSFSDSLTALSLSLSIPIDSWIPGTRTSQAINRAGAEVTKARLDLQNTKNDAMNRIRSLTVSIRNSWRTIELSKLQLDIAERTYQLTEQAFQAGAVEFTTLETSRTDLSRANQQLLSDQAAYQQAMLDLAGALNLDWNEFIRSVR